MAWIRIAGTINYNVAQCQYVGKGKRENEKWDSSEVLEIQRHKAGR